MAEKKWHSSQVVKGSGGYGGPLTITPTEQKHKFIYVTGGNRPAIVDKIAELTGMEAVDGFKTSIPEDETALAIIDCGGALWDLSEEKYLNHQCVAHRKIRTTGKIYCA